MYLLLGFFVFLIVAISAKAIHDFMSKECRAEAFYPSVAVLEHTNWVVKTAVGLCTDLKRHGSLNPHYSYDCLPVEPEGGFKRPGGREASLRSSSAAPVVRSLSEHKSSMALRRVGFRLERTRELAILHRFP